MGPSSRTEAVTKVREGVALDPPPVKGVRGYHLEKLMKLYFQNGAFCAFSELSNAIQLFRFWKKTLQQKLLSIGFVIAHVGQSLRQ